MPRLRPYSCTVRPKVIVPQDFVLELLDRYQKANRIKREALAERVGMTPTAVSKKKARGSESFTLADLKEWVRALDIPEESAAEAVLEYLKH